jgi:pimeloyl-ACP methyl ester carboxylesterase
MKIAIKQIGQGVRQAALVHGIGMSGDTWQELAEMMAERYNYSVILVDLRGHGGSSHMKSYLIREFAQDLKDTLPKGLDILMGHGLGGRIAAEAAAHLQPKQLICLDPATRMSTIFKMALIHLFPTFLRNAFGIVPKGVSTKTRRRISVAINKWDIGMIKALLSEGVRRDFRALTPTMPSTVVLADRSFAVSKEKEHDLELVGWKIRHKTGFTHEMHLQNPEVTLSSIADLITNT